MNSEPPVEERVSLRCIWLVEFYTPANYEKLLAGFVELGWDDESVENHRTSPGTWLRELRNQPHSGGWLILGAIVNPGTRVFGPHRFAQLPPSADLVIGNMFSITSSVTCIVLCFVLKESETGEYDAALRKARATQLRPMGRGHSVHNPPSLKAESIGVIRGKFRAEFSEWLQRQLPGLFASGHLGGLVPSCELMTLKVGRPLDGAIRDSTTKDSAKKAPRIFENYLSLLDVKMTIGAWRSVDQVGLCFFEQTRRDRLNKTHAIAAISESDLENEKAFAEDSKDRWAIASHFDDRIHELLSRWAISALLQGYETRINEVRDSTALHLSKSRPPKRLLQRLRAFVSNSAETAFVAAELRRFAKPDSGFSNEVAEFKSVESNQAIRERTLGEAIRANIQFRADWLSKENGIVRELVTQYGSIIGAEENLRVQQQVKSLTIVTIAIAVLAFLVSVLAFVATAESSHVFRALIGWSQTGDAIPANSSSRSMSVGKDFY